MQLDPQYQLAIIDRHVDKDIIEQRITDGYINATAVCKSCGKNFADYKRLKTTDEYLTELTSVMGIPIAELIQVVMGGIPKGQGTWVHPRVAIHLGQWASPKFVVILIFFPLFFLVGHVSLSWVVV
jgi:hypothetical protein